jgi:hypothetical protein
VTDALARLECRLDSVEHALSDLEHRLQALETTGTPLSAGTPAVAYAELHPVAASPADVASTLGLLGRTLVVFAGAYLLRALTESGTLAVPTGIALGLAYAAVWSVVAFRTGAVSRLSATLFGGCTIVLALPLLFEATTRFDLLSPAASATALALATAVVLAVAWRRDLHALAWVAVLGACVLASVLLVETGRAIPFVTALAGLGVATLWLGYEREWKMLRWVSAVVADLAVLALVGRALADPPRDAPAAVLAVQLLLLVGYLASIAVRTLVRGRTVVLFEAVQTGALLIVGLAGAVVVASRAGTGVAVLGVSSWCWRPRPTPWRLRSSSDIRIAVPTSTSIRPLRSCSLCAGAASSWGMRFWSTSGQASPSSPGGPENAISATRSSCTRSSTSPRPSS